VCIISTTRHADGSHSFVNRTTSPPATPARSQPFAAAFLQILADFSNWPDARSGLDAELLLHPQEVRTDQIQTSLIVRFLTNAKRRFSLARR